MRRGQRLRVCPRAASQPRRCRCVSAQPGVCYGVRSLAAGRTRGCWQFGLLSLALKQPGLFLQLRLPVQSQREPSTAALGLWCSSLGCTSCKQWLLHWNNPLHANWRAPN